MNTRIFFKSIFIGSVGIFGLKFGKSIILEFKDQEPPFERITEFQFKDLYFKLMVTSNILIPTDYGLELNHYGNFCKVIGKIVDSNIPLKATRCLKVEGPIRTKDEMLKFWQDDIRELTNLALENWHKVEKNKSALKLCL